MPGAPWPEGVRLQLGQMLVDGRVCVPEALASQVVQSQHLVSWHVGVKRQVIELNRRFAWPGSIKVSEIASKVRLECPTLKACDQLNWGLRQN